MSGMTVSGAFVYLVLDFSGRYNAVMDLVHYDVIIWGSPSGAMHCAFCTRQKFVVPPLSHVKRPVFFGCLARSGNITNLLPNKKM